MRYPDRAESRLPRDAREQPVDVVTDCPFCKSTRVTTTDKSASSSTYWRCHACGEVWNPGRVDAARAFRHPPWAHGRAY